MRVSVLVACALSISGCSFLGNLFGDEEAPVSTPDPVAVDAGDSVPPWVHAAKTALKDGGTVDVDGDGAPDIATTHESGVTTTNYTWNTTGLGTRIVTTPEGKTTYDDQNADGIWDSIEEDLRSQPFRERRDRDYDGEWDFEEVIRYDKTRKLYLIHTRQKDRKTHQWTESDEEWDGWQEAGGSCVATASVVLPDDLPTMDDEARTVPLSLGGDIEPASGHASGCTEREVSLIKSTIAVIVGRTSPRFALLNGKLASKVVSGLLDPGPQAFLISCLRNDELKGLKAYTASLTREAMEAGVTDYPVLILLNTPTMTIEEWPEILLHEFLHAFPKLRHEKPCKDGSVAAFPQQGRGVDQTYACGRFFSNCAPGAPWTVGRGARMQGDWDSGTSTDLAFDCARCADDDHRDICGIKQSKRLHPFPCTQYQQCWDGDDEATRAEAAECKAGYSRACDDQLLGGPDSRYFLASLEEYGYDEGIADVCVDDSTTGPLQASDDLRAGCGRIDEPLVTDTPGAPEGASHVCAATWAFWTAFSSCADTGFSVEVLKAFCADDA